MTSEGLKYRQVKRLPKQSNLLLLLLKRPLSLPIICVDRLASDDGHTIAQEIEEMKLKGLHRVRTSDPKGNVVEAVLEIRYRRIKVLLPIGNLISVFCIISWRIFWMTMLDRTCPDAEPKMALKPAEIDLLDCWVKDSKRSRDQLPLSRYLEKIAQLGGYLARSKQSPPGNIVMWRGMRRLADMQLGFNLASERYG